MLAFCVISNGNKLRMVTSRIKFNGQLNLLWCFEIKPVATYNLFSTLSIAKMPTLSITGKLD